MRKVSLIATVLNEKDSVGRWLEQIGAQTKLPDEIVICDGGSADGTAELLAKSAETFNPQLRVISKPGANIAAGRNAAIESALGDIIVVSDAGVRPEPDWFEKIITPFETDPKTEAVAGSFRFAGDTPFRRAAAAYLGTPWTSKTFLPSSRSVAFTRQAWKKAGGYPEFLTCAAEDTLFNSRLLEKGFQFVQAPGAIVHWDMRPNLACFLRMISRNAFGDAEAGISKGMRQTAIKLIVLIFAWGLGMWIWLPFLFGLPIFFVGIKTARRRVPFGSWFYFAALSLLGGGTYMFGYLRGSVRPRTIAQVQDSKL